MAGCAAQPVTQGWREAVISVTDVDAWAAFYVDVLGWEVREQGQVDSRTLAAWRLPAEASARFAMVANPKSDRGFVRIIDFHGVTQTRIRPHAQAWESGGIYNMNVRVADIAAIEAAVTRAGWQAPSAPVNFIFGPFNVWEWIPRHPDGVRMAFAQRVEPPLEGWPHLKVSSRTFNSTQIVSDMARAVAFYQGVLGFKTYLEHQGASEAAADHVLGLSHQAMTQVVRDVRIVSPSGENDGSVELLLFKDYSGRDFSKRAVPPNLGNLMLRYPVQSIASLAEHLTAAGVELVVSPTSTRIAPYGNVRMLAVQAPDGAWLEFFETLE
ncbi:MAG: VOC family protein [Gammaproteobacteria bacterium]